MEPRLNTVGSIKACSIRRH